MRKKDPYKDMSIPNGLEYLRDRYIKKIECKELLTRAVEYILELEQDNFNLKNSRSDLQWQISESRLSR